MKNITQINAYIFFNGNCREAMGFYKNCLGGELSLLAVSDTPAAAEMPATEHDKIMHAALMNEGLVLFASDMIGTIPVNGNKVQLSLTCSSEEETNTYFARLSEGGKVTHPLHEFFSGILGTLTDKYGVNWMLFYDKK